MKILLVCNAGMSSSLLIEKIKIAASERNYDVEVAAASMRGLEEEVGSWDICLIGPQISYAIDKIKMQLQIPVLLIEPRLYALADGVGVLAKAVQLYEVTK